MGSAGLENNHIFEAKHGGQCQNPISNNSCCRSHAHQRHTEKIVADQQAVHKFQKRKMEGRNGRQIRIEREKMEEKEMLSWSREKKTAEHSCLTKHTKVRSLVCKPIGPQFEWHEQTNKLREKVRNRSFEHDTCINSVVPVQVEECRSHTNEYEDALTKVYVLSGLSLYCRMDLLAIVAYGLVDTGAGCNLINSSTVRRIVEANGKHAMSVLSIRNQRLVVKVANDKTWVLKKVATLQFEVGGETFTDDFWVTPEMQEDVLLGLPALRKMGADLSLSKVAKEGKDCLMLRDTGTRVPLSYYPSGITSNPLPLTPISRIDIPAGTAKLVDVQLRPGTGVVVRKEEWPMEGIVTPTGDACKRAVTVDSINSIEDTRLTTVLLRNATNSDLTYWPGDTVAHFEPATIHTEQDSQQNDLLFVGADGKLHKKITYSSPTARGSYSCGDPALPLSPVPVAKVRVSWTNQEEVQEVVELNVNEIHAYALDTKLIDKIPTGIDQVDRVRDRIDELIALPKAQHDYSWKDVKVNPLLSEEEAQQVSTFLEKHADFFEPITQSYPNKLLPDFATQIIKLKEGTLPFRSKAYPLSRVKQEKMKEIVNSQLSKGMISRSQSPFTSPAFLVPKPGGKWRLVIDFRKLNQALEKSSWPIPKMDDILNQLAGSTYLSSLDLVDGFHQCSLHQDSKQYTAFVTATGVFEYNTTPMGLATSPNHFQFVMDTILRGGGEETEDLIGKKCFLYIDDLLVFSKGSLEDHLATLEKVIVRLSKFGLKAKATKVAVAMFELKFLGYMVGKEGKWPDPSKTEAIDRIPIPKGKRSKSQLLAFLGLCSFYRGFIEPRDWGRTTGPLYELLKIRGRSIDTGWQDRHTTLFNELKQKFKEAPILAHPHFDKPFIVKTDCSKTHAGAILSQVIEGKERVIEYASTKLTTPQRRWHMTHLEGWAVVWALGKWATYLDGREDTTILVDHKALLFLRHNQYADASGKLTRWFTYIDTFRPKFIHRAGKDHADCDAFTRMYEGDPDIIWDQQDSTADWIFDVLDRYLEKTAKVQLLNFGGPSGGNGFNKNRSTTMVEPEALADYPRQQGDVIVAVPPSTRRLIAPMFNSLKESGAKWAVWCPLRVLQASYFTEPDVQLIVVQGSLGYGCTRRAEPERGAWITHGLGLEKNIFLKSSNTKTGPKFIERRPTTVKVSTIARDWESWRLDALDSSEEPLPEVISTLTAMNLEQDAQQCEDFASMADKISRVLRKHSKEISEIESQWVQHSCMARGWEQPTISNTAYCQAPLMKVMPMANRAYLGIPNQGVDSTIRIRGVHEQEGDAHNSEDISLKWKLQPVVQTMIEKRIQQRDTAKDLQISYNVDKHCVELQLLRDKLDKEEKELAEGELQGNLAMDLTTRSIRHYQQKDPECKALREILTTEKDKTAWKTTLAGGPRQQFELRGDVIWVKDRKSDNSRLFVPTAMRKHIVYISHKCKMLQHPGVETLYKTLSVSFWWPRMKSDIKEVVNGCLACVRSKATQPRDQGPAMAVIPEAPFTVVGADIAGPFPPSESHKYRYIITFVDHYSRWIRLVPIVEADAKSVANALLKHWVKDYGVPDLLVSDKGSQFTSEVMTETANYLGIKLHTFPAESQWRNGRVERVHRYIKERLRLWKKKDIRNWPELLPFIEMAHHFMVMPQYGMSSYEILYGHPARLPFTQKEWTTTGLPTAAAWIIGSTHERMQRIQNQFNEIEEKQILQRLARLNKARTKLDLKPGQQVLFYTKGTKDKLTCLWSDIAIIDRKVNDNTFIIRTPDNSTMSISSQRLRPFHASQMQDYEKLGPLSTDYPHLDMGEAKSSEAAGNMGLLETTVLKKKPRQSSRQLRYKYVDEKGNTPIVDNTISLTYGQYVAYATGEEGGWVIGRYLGEHPTTPKAHVTLRKMNIYKKDVLRPRQYVWHYEWKANRGRNVLSKIEKGLDRPPGSKGTGGLRQFWVQIPSDKLICAVELTQQGKLTSSSYREICSNTGGLIAINKMCVLPFVYYA